MTKYAAFGTTLAIGTRQIETATIVGTITLAGNATIVVTAAGMTGSPITKNVAVLLNDTADIVAGKVITSLQGDANITAMFDISGSGAQVVLTRKIAAANDGTLNVSSANGTCTGLTAQPTSANTLAGVASFTVGQIKSINGIGLRLDTADVTTLDSTDGWEEVIPTILRTDELSMELVYDPNLTAHGTTSGLAYYERTKTLGFVTVTFPGAVNWSYPANVTRFEPGGSVDGYLSASVSLKITGKPTLV